MVTPRPFYRDIPVFNLTLSIAFLFMSLTYSSAPNEFLNIDVVLIFSGIFFVVIIQYCLHLIAEKVFGKNLLIISVFCFINIYAVNLIVNKSFVVLHPYYGKLLVFLIAVFILHAIYKIADDYKFLSKAAPATFMASSLAIAGFSYVSHGPLAQDDSIPFQGASSNWTQNVGNVEFIETPNVYFISFDSIVSRTLLEKNIKLKTTAYHEFLDKNFSSFNNFFADRIPSRRSLNSFLALDIEHFDALGAVQQNENFFTGYASSPLMEIFSHNGYETTTFYHGTYFGNSKGPYIDNYHFSTSYSGKNFLERWLNNPGGACEFINTENLQALTFFGYCFAIKNDRFRALTSRPLKTDQVDELMVHLKRGAAKTTPQVFLSYIYSPGHTYNGYNPLIDDTVTEYQEFYERESKKTALYMNRLVEFVRKEDPTAILFIFGDHGPYMSRGISLAEDSEFVIQDTYGVYGGVYPKDRCREFLPETSDFGVTTPSLIARQLIECLTGGEDAMIVNKPLRLPDLGDGISRRYEDYFYE